MSQLPSSEVSILRLESASKLSGTQSEAPNMMAADAANEGAPVAIIYRRSRSSSNDSGTYANAFTALVVLGGSARFKVVQKRQGKCT